jgi:hypothetical protein
VQKRGARTRTGSVEEASGRLRADAGASAVLRPVLLSKDSSWAMLTVDCSVGRFSPIVMDRHTNF